MTPLTWVVKALMSPSWHWHLCTWWWPGLHPLVVVSLPSLPGLWAVAHVHALAGSLALCPLEVLHVAHGGGAAPHPRRCVPWTSPRAVGTCPCPLALRCLLGPFAFHCCTCLVQGFLGLGTCIGVSAWAVGNGSCPLALRVLQGLFASHWCTCLVRAFLGPWLVHQCPSL